MIKYVATRRADALFTRIFHLPLIQKMGDVIAGGLKALVQQDPPRLFAEGDLNR